MANCTCVPCGSCNGTGNVWFTFDGKYLGNHRSDDLDNLERCDDCEGSGIAEDGRPKATEVNTIQDGFGNQWAKCGHLKCDLQIVRPGKVQCSGFCEGATFASSFHSSGTSEHD